MPISNSTYTVEAWIKPDVMNVGEMIGWGNYGARNQATGFQLHPNGLYHYWWQNDLFAPVGSLIGSWHHVAATYDGVTRRILLDGNVVASDTPSGHNVPHGSNLTIGRGFPGNPTFPGEMDEVRVWDVARSPSQIQATLGIRLAGDEPGLVVYYPMDEGFGSLTADASGNGNTGRLQGTPPWALGARPIFDQVTSSRPVDGTNSVLHLDGADDHVTVPAGIWFGDEFTIETWVFERSYNYFSRVMDFGNGAGVDNILLALSQERLGRPQFNIFPSGQFILAPNPIPLNEWVHLAVTVKTNRAIMYVNGVAVVSGPIGTANAVVRTKNYIGRSNWPPPDENVKGQLDDFRIWDVARTPEQLQQFSTEPVSPDDPNLLLNYRFDEASGTTALDSRSASPQNGTLVNGADRQSSIPDSVTLTGARSTIIAASRRIPKASAWVRRSASSPCRPSAERHWRLMG
jgi:hypothetical protein